MCRGFESHYLSGYSSAGLEQRKILKRILSIGRWPNRLRYLLWEQVIASSSLVLPTISKGVQVKVLFGNRLHIIVCLFGVIEFETAHCLLFALNSVVEYHTFNVRVLGSSPRGRTMGNCQIGLCRGLQNRVGRFNSAITL